MLHILSNAVKYSHVDGTVKISVCETQELPNGYSVYRFDVEDNGIGIDSDALTRIFEPFERVKTRLSVEYTVPVWDLPYLKSTLTRWAEI